MVGIFLQSMLIGYSGAVMPGSLLTYTIDKSLKHGAKAGLIISIGHALLEFILVILLFFGIGRYLSTNIAQIVIGIIGGAFLIFSGIMMVKDIYSGNVNIDFKNDTDNKYGNILIGGALVSASNPYLFVWWTAVGLGLIMNSYTIYGIWGILVFYLGHILADITWYVFLSALISKTRGFINLKVYKILVALLALCLIIFGAGFLVSSWNLLKAPAYTILNHSYYFSRIFICKV